MNILHLIESSEAGGAESVVYFLAAAFRARGHDCVVGLLQKGWLNERLEAAGFEIVMIQQQSSYDLRCIARLAAFIKKREISIVHAHEFMMNTYGSVTGLFAGVPVVSTVHGKNYYSEKGRRRIAYRLVSRISNMVAVSEDLGAFLVKKVGIFKENIATIYNGVDFPESEYPRMSPSKLQLVRDSFGISARSPILITVGMLVAVKDHSTLLRALANLVHGFPDTVLIVCGDGELRGQLEELAEQLRITRNIRFAGFRDNVFELLQLASVYVCSSVSEGLSLSILEAMAAGKPVVATNVGGNPEVVRDGETGLLVSPQNPEALAAKIASLLGEPCRAERLGLNGKRRADDMFSGRRMVDAYESLYQSLLVRN